MTPRQPAARRSTKKNFWRGYSRSAVPPSCADSGASRPLEERNELGAADLRRVDRRDADELPSVFAVPIQIARHGLSLNALVEVPDVVLPLRHSGLLLPFG